MSKVLNSYKMLPLFVLCVISTICRFITSEATSTTTSFYDLLPQDEERILEYPGLLKIKVLKVILEEKIAPLKKKLKDVEDERDDALKKLRREQVDNIFNKFMAAQSTLLYCLDEVISTATNGLKSRVQDITCATPILPWEVDKMEDIIMRILPYEHHSVITAAKELAEAFYCAINDSKSRASIYFRGNLTKSNVPLWESVAIAAAFRKSRNIYSHRSKAAKTYFFFMSKGKPESIIDLIKAHNSWTITKRDIQIINILLYGLLQANTLKYEEYKVTTKDGKVITLAIPLQSRDESPITYQ